MTPDPHIIPFAERVQLACRNLRQCGWGDRGACADVRKYPEVIQPHGGVVCRFAAQQLAREIQRDEQRKRDARCERRNTVRFRLEDEAAKMRAKYGRVQGPRGRVRTANGTYSQRKT